MKQTFVLLSLFVVFWVLWIFIPKTYMEYRAEQYRIVNTQRQVQEWAEKIDRERDKAGAYKDQTFGEIGQDSWGTPLVFDFRRGGLTESFEIRSLGRDKRIYTRDDIVARRSTLNFKGLREGIKEDAQEVAKEKARGIIKGAIEELKGEIKN